MRFEYEFQNMAYLIFKLKYVTQEEADEVRQLLTDHNIAYYETGAGMFGTSVAGLWLKDDTQQDSAKALLGDYSTQRQQRVRNEYQQQRALGQEETFWQRYKSQPWRYLLAFGAIALILYFSIMPFFKI